MSSGKGLHVDDHVRFWSALLNVIIDWQGSLIIYERNKKTIERFVEVKKLTS